MNEKANEESMYVDQSHFAVSRENFIFKLMKCIHIYNEANIKRNEKVQKDKKREYKEKQKAPKKQKDAKELKIRESLKIQKTLSHTITFLILI